LEEYFASIFRVKRGRKAINKPKQAALLPTDPVGFLPGLLFGHGDGGTMFLRNVGKHLPNYMALHAERQLSLKCSFIVSSMIRQEIIQKILELYNN
jgi:hypothetical protein